MPTKLKIDLDSTEAAILIAAAGIYAASIGGFSGNRHERKKLREAAIDEAIELAKAVEKEVKTEGEV